MFNGQVQKYHIKTMELSFNKVDGTMIDGVDLIQYQAAMQSLQVLNCGQFLMSLYIRLALLGKI